MIQHGANIKSQLQRSTYTAANIWPNCHYRLKENATTHRHSQDRETPFTVHWYVYLSQNKKKKTACAQTVFSWSEISNNSVPENTAQLCKTVVIKFMNEAIICPAILQKGLFTTSVFENTAHNPSATTATTASSFHRTNISTFRHPDLCNRNLCNLETRSE